jgi:gas vesicle protein
MFKRIFWLAIGLGLGFGMSFWIMRFVRETVDRYRPERVSQDLAGAISKLGDDLRAAVREGRMAMREREEELRSEMERSRTADRSRVLDV